MISPSSWESRPKFPIKLLIPHLQPASPFGLNQIIIHESIPLSLIIHAFNTIKLEKYSPFKEQDTLPFTKIISFILKSKMILILRATAAFGIYISHFTHYKPKDLFFISPTPISSQSFSLIMIYFIRQSKSLFKIIQFYLISHKNTLFKIVSGKEAFLKFISLRIKKRNNFTQQKSFQSWIKTRRPQKIWSKNKEKFYKK